MRLSRRFIKFAMFLCVSICACSMVACKGRTTENMEPTGDTIEVVIAQDSIDEI